MSGQGEVTQLLHAIRDGDKQAFDRVVPLVYEELKRLARSQLRSVRRGQTLDTVGLVNEAYLKMAKQQGLALEDRGQFLAVCACAMRQVVVQSARARHAKKRGSGERPVTFDEGKLAGQAQVEQILDVDRALEKLRRHNERLAHVVECRFFAGLNEEETALALDVSLRTAQREWKRARAWLGHELAGDDAE